MSVRRAVFTLFVTLAACRPKPVVPEVTDSGADGAGRTPAVELSAQGMQTARIRVETASSEAFVPRLRLIGSVGADPHEYAHIGARIPGRVVAIRVRPGDQVHSGDPLIDIETGELHQVAMEYLTAIARARQANDALARQRQLVAEHVGAEVELRRAEADAASASAALREGEEHLHFLGLTDVDIQRMRSRTSHGSARSTVRATIDGRIENVSVALGQVVSGTEDLLTITRLESVWVSLRVHERDAESVVMGTGVDITVPSVPERIFSGTVAFVGAVVDSTTRTLEARVSLPNRDRVLRPGMSATAQVVLRETTRRLWLPIEAVQTYGEERVVFVQAGERRFEPRAVIVGDERGGWVPVIEGIRVGDSVVTRGAFALRGELERAAIEGE